MTADSSSTGPREPAAHKARGATPADTAHEHESRHDYDRTYRDDVLLPTSRRQSLVSWGAVWAGLVVTIATFLLLQLVFFALGALGIGDEADDMAGILSAVAALVAFLVGGLVAGATSVWREGKGGLFHGVVLWALGLVAIVFLTTFGGGALLGTVANVLADTANLQQTVDTQGIDMAQAIEDAREGAGWAVIGMLLPLVAAAIGGSIGGKLGEKAPDATPDRMTRR